MTATRNKLFAVLVAALAVYATPVHAQDPSPGAFFDQEVYVGQDDFDNSAYYLDYFNYFTYDPTDINYVYKYGFGWLYYFGGTNGIEDTDAYFYDFEEDDVFYTAPDLYPYIYSFKQDTYLYYFEGSNPREFYNFDLHDYFPY